MTAVTTEFNPISLSDRIKNAESNDELLSLETEGNEYKYASDKTRRRWEKRIFVRQTELAKTDTKPKLQDKKKTKGRNKK